MAVDCGKWAAAVFVESESISMIGSWAWRSQKFMFAYTRFDFLLFLSSRLSEHLTLKHTLTDWILCSTIKRIYCLSSGAIKMACNVQRNRLVDRPRWLRVFFRVCLPPAIIHHWEKQQIVYYAKCCFAIIFCSSHFGLVQAQRIFITPTKVHIFFPISQ